MSIMSIEKVTALPETFTPNTIYLVKAVGVNEVRMVFTSSDGAVKYEMVGVDESTVTQIVSNILVSLLNKENGLAGLNSSGKIADSLLPDVVATAGTFPKVTFDLKGRVIRGQSLLPSDIPDLDWSKIQYNKPTTLAGYGITDALASVDVATTATANKLLKLNTDAKLPADITGNAATANKWSMGRTISMTGDITWSISGFDGSGNATGVATMSNSGVTAGTYNKATHVTPMTVNSKGLVTSMGTETAITPEWDNILNKPTTLSDLGMSDIVSVATPDKVLRLDVNAKLPASVTGNAASATKLEVARKIGMTGDVTWSISAFDGTGDVTAVGVLANTGVVAGTYGSSTEFYPYEVDAKGRIIRVLPAVSFSTSWDKTTNTPTTLQGYGITDALEKSEATTVPTSGKLLRLDNDAKLPADITGTAAASEKLKTSRKITLTGDVVADPVQFDGGADITINTKVSVSGESFHPFLLFGG